MSNSGGWIVVRNWDKFQHRDVLRSEETVPAWIKLYTKLLHNPDYESLTMTQRGLLTTIWLEYGASDGLLSLRRISAAVAQIPGQRLRSDTLDSLIHAGFISVVAGRPSKQSASLEKRREEKNPPTPLPGKEPQNGRRRKPTQEEVPAMIDVVTACQHFIAGQAWDDSFDHAAILEEFGRIERGRRTQGILTPVQRQELIDQWKTTRQERYGAKETT